MGWRAGKTGVQHSGPRSLRKLKTPFSEDFGNERTTEISRRDGMQVAGLDSAARAGKETRIVDRYSQSSNSIFWTTALVAMKWLRNEVRPARAAALENGYRWKQRRCRVSLFRRAL